MLTVDQIIKSALEEIGEISSGATPTAQEYADCLVRLNTLIAGIRGTTPKTDTQTISTVDGTQAYATAANTRRVLSFSDTTINVMSPETFDKYGSDGTANVMIDYTASPPEIIFGVTPSTTGSVYTYRRSIEPTALVLGGTPDFTADAQDMLIFGLAYRISPQFNVPEQKRMAIRQDYKETLAEWKAHQSYRADSAIVRPPNIV